MADKYVDQFKNTITGDIEAVRDTEARDQISNVQSQVTSLNETLTEQTINLTSLLETSDDIIIHSDTRFYALLTGHVVSLVFYVYGQILTQGTQFTICTLPDNLKPPTTIYNSYSTQTGLAILMIINANGEVRLMVDNSQTLPSTNSNIIRQTITYVCV